MKFENSETPNRRKLAIVYGTICLFLVFLFSLKYFLAPDDFKSGLKSFRTWFSLVEYIVVTLVVLMGSFFWITYSRIVVLIDLDLDSNRLAIAKIDRFRFHAKTYIVPLSDVRIYIERFDNYTRFFQKTDDSVAVYVEHKDFGDVRIGPQDFPNDIKTIVEIFENIKFNRARQVREGRNRNRRRL